MAIKGNIIHWNYLPAINIDYNSLHKIFYYKNLKISWNQNNNQMISLEIVEMDEPGAAGAVANLRFMYEGCMNTDVIEDVGLTPLESAMDPLIG